MLVKLARNLSSRWKEKQKNPQQQQQKAHRVDMDSNKISYRGLFSYLFIFNNIVPKQPQIQV